MTQCPECSQELYGNESVCPHCLAPLQQGSLPSSALADLTPASSRMSDWAWRPSSRPAGENPVLTSPIPTGSARPTYTDHHPLVVETQNLPPRSQRTGRRIAWVWLALAAVLLVGLGAAGGYLLAQPATTSQGISAYDQGMQLYAQGRWDSAYYQFSLAVSEEMLKALPAPAPALSMMGWAAYEQRNYADAVSLFTSALGHNSRQADALAGLGLAKLAIGDTAAAQTAIEQAMNTAPNSALAWRAKGELALAVGTPGDAVAALSESLQRDAKDAQAMRLLGVAQMANGQYEESVKTLGPALTDQSEPRVWRALIDDYLALGDFEPAVALAQRWLDMDPKSAERQYAFAQALLRADRPAEAADAFALAVELGRQETPVEDALRQWGLALSQMQRYEEALDPLRAALVVDDADARAVELQGWALARLGRCAEALPIFQQALSLQPDLQGAQEGEAACKQWLGQ